MSHENPWHVTQAQLADYARGRSTLAQAASVEAHLTACTGCRSALEEVLPEQPIDRMWQHILSAVGPAAPRRSRHAARRMRMWATSCAAAVCPPRRVGIAALALLLGLALTVQLTSRRDDETGAGSATAAAGSSRRAAVPPGSTANLQADRTTRLRVPETPNSGNPSGRTASYGLESPGRLVPGPVPPPSPAAGTRPSEPRDRIAWRSGYQPV
jgi:hypothetical protein